MDAAEPNKTKQREREKVTSHIDSYIWNNSYEHYQSMRGKSIFYLI